MPVTGRHEGAGRYYSGRNHVSASPRQAPSSNEALGHGYLPEDKLLLPYGFVWRKWPGKFTEPDPTPFLLDFGVSQCYPGRGGYAWARGDSPLLPIRDYSVTGGAMLRRRKRSHLSKIG